MTQHFQCPIDRGSVEMCKIRFPLESNNPSLPMSTLQLAQMIQRPLSLDIIRNRFGEKGFMLFLILTREFNGFLMISRKGTPGMWPRSLNFFLSVCVCLLRMCMHSVRVYIYISTCDLHNVDSSQEKGSGSMYVQCRVGEARQ